MEKRQGQESWLWTLERVWSPSRSEGKQWFVCKRQTREQWNVSAYILVRDRKAKRFRYQGKGAANMLIVHNRPPDPLNGYKTHQIKVCSPDSLNHSLGTQQKDGIAAVFYLFPCSFKFSNFSSLSTAFSISSTYAFCWDPMLWQGGWVLGLVYCLQGTTPSPAQEANGKSKKRRIGFFQIGKSFGLQLQSQNQSNFYMLRDGTS